MGTIRKALGTNLKTLRGERSQDAMAEFLGIPKRTYVRFELGQAFPQDATLRQMVSKLKVEEDVLVQLPGVEAPKPKTKKDRSALLGEIVIALSDVDESKLAGILAAVRSTALDAGDESEEFKRQSS